MRPAPMEGAEAWPSSAETPEVASCVEWLDSSFARSRLRSLHSMRDMGSDLSCLHLEQRSMSTIWSGREDERRGGDVPPTCIHGR